MPWAHLGRDPYPFREPSGYLPTLGIHSILENSSQSLPESWRSGSQKNRDWVHTGQSVGGLISILIWLGILTCVGMIRSTLFDQSFPRTLSGSGFLHELGIHSMLENSSQSLLESWRSGWQNIRDWVHTGQSVELISILIWVGILTCVGMIRSTLFD